MAGIEAYFKGLSDRTRLRIVNLLLNRELCGCDIQYVLDMGQSNVSRHLTYLKRAGLVADRRDGYRVFYRLTDPEARSVATLVDYLRDALRGDKTLAADARRLKEAIRDGACTISEVQLIRPAISSAATRSRRL